jgi:multifunctional 2-oxoglutarate metabolism enzyme
VSDLATRFGANEWLVEDMYEQYRADPSSVSGSWQEFFTGYKGVGTMGTESPVRRAHQEAAPEGTEILKGPAATIARNIAASRDVPTATSARVVPAKLLEVNRTIVNDHLRRARGGRISFTHLIGYAMVKALGAVPNMNSSYTEVDGKAAVVHHDHVNLGLAVDVEKSDGSRTLLVPNIKEADTLAFREFWLAYEELIRKVRNKKISLEDFAGTTVSLTNPGTVGTVHSVPRLMPGQGVIVGVGAIGYPAEYEAADTAVLANIGVSKVLSVTSTYDHRIIRGRNRVCS